MTTVTDSTATPGYGPITSFRDPLVQESRGFDGRLWIEWTATETSPGEWWALGQGGRPQGRVAPSRRIAVAAADSEVLWAVEHDALDVPFVVRYRIAEARE